MSHKNQLFYRKKDSTVTYPVSQQQMDLLAEYDRAVRGNGSNTVGDLLRYTHSCVRRVTLLRGSKPCVVVVLGSCCSAVPTSLKNILAECLDKAEAGTVNREEREQQSSGGCH